MDLRKNFYKNGYFLFKNLFKREEILKIKKEMTDCFNLISKSTYKEDLDIIKFFNKDIQCFLNWVNLCQNLTSFFQLSVDGRLINSLKEIGLNIPLFNMKPNLLFSNKNTAKHVINWKIPSHQDWPSMRGSLNSVTAWIPFIDVTEELGPLEIAPGSHKEGSLNFCSYGSGLIIDQSLDNFNYEPIQMLIGDVLIFNSFTVHRSGVNLTEDKIRWSAQFRFDDAAESSYIERKYPRYKKEMRIDVDFDNTFPVKQNLVDLFKKYENE
jgi:phytanoyl-CoA hydroxylase